MNEDVRDLSASALALTPAGARWFSLGVPRQLSWEHNQIFSPFSQSPAQLPPLLAKQLLSKPPLMLLGVWRRQPGQSSALRFGPTEE